MFWFHCNGVSECFPEAPWVIKQLSPDCLALNLNPQMFLYEGCIQVSSEPDIMWPTPPSHGPLFTDKNKVKKDPHCCLWMKQSLVFCVCVNECRDTHTHTHLLENSPLTNQLNVKWLWKKIQNYNSNINFKSVELISNKKKSTKCILLLLTIHFIFIYELPIRCQNRTEDTKH